MRSMVIYTFSSLERKGSISVIKQTKVTREIRKKGIIFHSISCVQLLFMAYLKTLLVSNLYRVSQEERSKF
jgi:hypothetical protein